MLASCDFPQNQNRIVILDLVLFHSFMSPLLLVFLSSKKVITIALPVLLFALDQV